MMEATLTITFPPGTTGQEVRDYGMSMIATMLVEVARATPGGMDVLMAELAKWEALDQA